MASIPLVPDTCPASNQDPARPAKTALGSLADITAALEQSIGRIAHRPEKVELEFSASLSAECDRWIVSGEGEAEFKVSLARGEGE
jgi:Trypsin-co-occurring domain 1